MEWWALGGTAALVAGLIVTTVALVLTGHAVNLRLRRWARRKLTRTARLTLRRFRARVDRFKFTGKAHMRRRLLADPVVAKAVALQAAAQEDPDVGVDLDGSWERAEDYLEEIVPSFSILSYFRVGYAAARVVLGSLYRTDVDPADMERLRPLFRDKSKSLLFLVNHRSNADFVLLALALAHRVALSYAVGEWARVWPLEPLFKSFGSYFVRRGERDPLYHTVLSRYVQHIVMEGVTQGVFLEGGLSRDGAFRAPKVGLLDSLLLAKNDPSFTKELIIIPISVSFDRVLEDESLIMEAGGARPERWKRRRLLWKQARAVATYLFLQSGPWMFAWQRRFGHAAVRVGTPMSADAWLKQHPGWLQGDRNARKQPLLDLANNVMEDIALNVAILPTPLLCSILHERTALPLAEARALFATRADVLRGAGARLWMPNRRLKDPFSMACRILKARGVVREVEGALLVPESGRAIVSYYAKGIPYDFAAGRRLTPVVPPQSDSAAH
jgi:glycerol-3-phosphate O-acyltransferase